MAKGHIALLNLSLLVIGGVLILAIFFRVSLELIPFAIYSLLGLAFAVMAILAVWNCSVSRRYGRLDPFELPTWFTINVFVFMVVPGIMAFEDPKALHARLGGDYGYLVLALLYVSLGTLALWLGYRFAPIRRGPRAKAFFQSVGMPQTAVIQPVVVLSLYAASVGIRLFQLATGQFGYLQDSGSASFLPIRQWLYYGAQIWVVVLPATALTVFRRMGLLLNRTALLIMVLIEVAFTFISGTKGPIIQLFIVLLACSLYAGRRIPWRLVIVLGLLFILVFPVNQRYRLAIVSGNVANRSLVEATATIVQLIGETWLRRPLTDNLQEFLNSVIGRQRALIQSVSLATYVTPETIPFRYGYDYFRLPLYILVPRAIWPSKPLLSGSVQFSIDYAGASADTIHSTAVTPFGDLYLNFGLPGILCGMFLLGILYRAVYQTAREANSERNLVLYLGLLFWMANIEAEIVGLIQGAIQQLIIFYILTRMMYRGSVRSNINSARSVDCAHHGVGVNDPLVK